MLCNYDNYKERTINMILISFYFNIVMFTIQIIFSTYNCTLNFFKSIFLEMGFCYIQKQKLILILI